MNIRLGLLSLVSGLLISTTAAGEGTFADDGFPCIIQPYDVVSLPSNIGGILSKKNVALGDRVREGQVLAEIDSRLERVQNKIARAYAENKQAVLSAESVLRLRQDRVDRLTKLVEANANSSSELDEANSSLELAMQELELRKFEREIRALELQMSDIRLDHHRVVSPMDGVVTEELLSVGQYVDQSTPLYKIARINPLKVRSILPVEYYERVKKGGAAYVVPEEPFATIYVGEVKATDWVFEAASGTFSTEIALINENYAIPVGHRCHVYFED